MTRAAPYPVGPSVQQDAAFTSRGRIYALTLSAIAIASFAALHPSHAMLLLGGLLILTLTVPDPRLLLPALFAVLPFQQSIVPGGTNVAAADVISAILFLLLLLKLLSGKVPSVGWVVAPMALFLGVATYSSLLNWEGRDTAVSLARTFCVTLVPMLAFANLDTRPFVPRRCLYAYLAATGVLSLFSVVAFVAGGSGKAMYALDLHKNAMGATYGVAIVGALGLILRGRLRGAARLVLIGSVVASSVGILLCLSRGAWLATAAGVLLLLLISRHRRVALLVLIPAVIALATVWRLLPEKATDYAVDISATSHNIRTRLVVMKHVMERFREEPVFGAGIGLRKVAEPHNMVILSLGETGVIGTAALLGTFAAGFLTFAHARYVGGEGEDVGLITTIGPAILLVTFGHGLMDVYWRRGIALAGWAMVGIAVATIVAARRKQWLDRQREPAQRGVASAFGS